MREEEGSEGGVRKQMKEEVIGRKIQDEERGRSRDRARVEGEV